MADFTVTVDKKVPTILKDGGVFLTQEFDPREEGFTPFASKSDAEAWAASYIEQVKAEEAAKAKEAADKKAAFEAEEALLKAGAAIEEPISE